MPKRIATESFEYNGKNYKPGDEIDVLPEHCELLTTLGKVKLEVEESEPQRRTRRKAAAA